MFEKRLKEISKQLESSQKEYYILSFKSHGREILFRDNSKALKFIKIKFKKTSTRKFLFNFLKKIFYFFFIKLRFFKIFSKKIKLSSEFGDVIFIGGQIKCFDFKKKIVLSFIRFEKNLKESEQKKDFLKSKEIQQKMFRKNLAPKIIQLNSKIPYSKEELLNQYSGGKNLEIMEKLYSFYEKEKIEEVSCKKYLDILKRKLKKQNIKDKFIDNLLEKISKKNINLLLAKVHGEFSKEQVLVKNNSFVFTDWDFFEKTFQKNLITRDFIGFFREKEDLFNEKEFLTLLKIFPDSVKKNIKTYLILNEIYNVLRRRGLYPLAKKRIFNILKNPYFS